MPQPWLQIGVLGTLAVVMLGACPKTINTLPPTVTPADPVQHYSLRVPDSLEIKAVDFDASLYPNVSGGGNLGVDTKLGGRAFVKVYAVHRKTGETYLLVFEDIARRRDPVLVIRFESSSGRASAP